MVKTVLVTPAQVDAARAVVQRRSESGRPVPEALRRIAEADHDDSGETASPLEAPRSAIAG
jgi:cytidylate kinase